MYFLLLYDVIDRAIKKLKELAPNVVWWRDINQVGQYIATGEATMGIGPGGRFQILIESNGARNWDRWSARGDVRVQ